MTKGIDRICSKGHKAISSLDMYCSECGGELPPFWVMCPKGHRVPRDSKYCGDCGRKIEEVK